MPAAHSQNLRDHVSGALFCIYRSAGQVQVSTQLPVWRMVYRVLAQPLGLLLDLEDAVGALGTTKNVALVGLIAPKQVHPHHLVHHHLWLPPVLA
jgi:hypothetical protein